MSLGVNDAIGIGACRAPMHCSHYGFQAALRIVLHRTRNKTNWCPKPKWILPQPMNKLHRHLPKKLLICSAGLCRTSSRESHTYDVDASFASLHCTCMAQDALRNMPSAPQRHPAMSQTRTNEDFEDNAFESQWCARRLIGGVRFVPTTATLDSSTSGLDTISTTTHQRATYLPTSTTVKSSR